jgi:PAS domain S-box-containing protein
VIELSRYAFETLREDEAFVVDRGQRDGDLSAILVVAPVSGHPVPGILERLEHEYALRDELDSDWAARPLALAHCEGRRMLILEDPGGEPLDRLLGQPMELSRFLRFAVGLAAALGKLHQRGLIHKDIKPANILVNAANGSIRLTGFGIASQLPRERQSPEPPEVIAGTLAYMAPEQTGRMNRSIDSRSDLYSLGVTFYEMLTGVLPFTASDPMEWVHCHIARQPVPPDQFAKEIPVPLSAIVIKLLAKTAEERYQTAAGLEVDLRRCLVEWESFGHIEPFPLGSRDIPDRLLIPEKLYGRDAEREVLLSAFDRVVASGVPELVFVSGYSGVGMSSVVNELHKAIVMPRGIFISGKFDQHKRNIPYATLAQAFQGLLRQILSKSEEEVGRWRDAIREAVGTNGQLMVNLIPDLELVIGKQPPVPDIPPQDAHNRFQMVFRRFLGVFARPEHPLALFLDDLQWLDAATLELLEHLITEAEVRHLLLIGAYRDNEVSPAHPLMRTLDAIRKAGASLQQIMLGPLVVDDVGRLVADSLHCARDSARPLAQLVHEKTGGNPFFTIQFFLALAEEGLLVFDPGTAAWTWDLARIRAKGYTDNVVDLMAGKLIRLPATTREALGELACLGSIAEVPTLTLVHGESEEEIHAALWESVRAGLVFRLDSAYTFVHDRVQEAAYALIPEGERAAAHLRIGRLLVSRTAPEEIEEKIFEIVNQLDRGAALIDSREERERVAELNLIAGKRAKSSTAYASALAYLVAGGALLPEDSWEQRYALTFALEFQRAECEFLTGDFAAAEERLSTLARRARNLVDSATVTRLQTELYTSLDRSERAVEVGLEYLRRVGMDWSPHPTTDDVRQEYERIWRQLGNRPIETLIDLPPMTDPACRATLDVLTVVEEPAHFIDENLRCLIVARMANLSLEHGNSDGSCVAYVHLGWFVVPRFGDYRPAFRFGKLGLDLVEKRGLERFRTRVAQCFGYFVNPWSRHLRTSVELLRRSFTTAQEAGDLKYAVYSCDRLVTFLLAVADPLRDVQLEAENGLEFARKAKFGYIVDVIAGQLRFIRTLRGLTPSFSSFNDAEFDESRFEQHLEADPHLVFATCWYWILKLQARFYAGDYASALAAASKAEPLVQTRPYAVIDLPDHFVSSKATGRPGVFESAEYLFYDALTRAAQYDSASSEERPQYRQTLAANHRQLEAWAQNCPENFANRAALVGAELARLEGRELDAQRLYEQAIRSARENGFAQNEGIANEFAAKFYLARGYATSAYAYLRNARYCYLRWGALGKVRQLDQRYPHLHEERAAVSSTATIGTPVEQLELETVIKSSQAVSGEIVLENLIKTLMMIAVEHAGAERGLLILPDGEEHRIAAEARTGRDGVEVQLQHGLVRPSELPDSLFRYVIRTQQSVILDDTSVQNLFSQDEYVRQQRPRSILCLPLVKQAKLMGVLYLENKLAPRVFTPKRLAMLELLASQAAISLDHARLYADLGRLNAELTQENSDRRKVEEALRASEERWRKLFENSSAGIALVATDGRFIAANLALQKMLGYTEAELQRLTAVEVSHEEDRAGTEERLAEPAEEQRRDHRIEKRYRRKDGNVIWADLSSTLVPAAGSTPGFFSAVIVDITERKRAEEELRESEQRLQDIVDNTTAVVFVKDLDLRYLLVNREYERRYRVRRDQIRGKTDFDILPHDIAGAVRNNDRQVIEAGVPIQFEETVPSDGGERVYVSAKFLLRDRTGKPYAVCGVATDITELKRLGEMQAALARERELFAQQRATELAKANEALRGCLDALASVPELDDFLGQVMAAITRQLGAVASTLRVRNFEQNTMTLEFVFQSGRVMTPDESKYPECWRSVSLEQFDPDFLCHYSFTRTKDEQRVATSLNPPAAIIRVLDPHSPMPEDQRFYLRELGVKTLLIIPLTSRGQVNGRLTFRFTEERDFHPEELEIARALATQASLAIHLTRLAKAARQSAVLEERNQLAAEIHDALAQSFTGISMQLGVAEEQLAAKQGDPLRQIELANEIAKFGLAEARRSILSLRSSAIEESGLTATLQRLVEHSNVAGRLRCDFRSDNIPEESLPPKIQHELLRFAQEAISNAVRHARPTMVSVTLRWEPPNLMLQVKDNGSGISRASLEKSEGFGLSNMRTRASQIDGKLDIQTVTGHGTTIVLTVPIPS